MGSELGDGVREMGVRVREMGSGLGDGVRVRVRRWGQGQGDGVRIREMGSGLGDGVREMGSGDVSALMSMKTRKATHQEIF